MISNQDTIAMSIIYSTLYRKVLFTQNKRKRWTANKLIYSLIFESFKKQSLASSRIPGFYPNRFKNGQNTFMSAHLQRGFPGGSVGKESACSAGGEET